MSPPLKIGVVSPYWNFWSEVVEDDPREFHGRLLASSIALIEDHGNVVWSVLASDLDQSLPEVDLVVVVSTMASPPESTRTFLEERAGVIVLVWAHHPSPNVPEPFTHESITVRGATVGASMLTASLSHAGVPHDIVLGNEQSAAVAHALHVAASAARVRTARLSTIGGTLSGYDFVRPSSEEIARLGIEIVSHTSEDFAARAAAIPETTVQGLQSKLGEAWMEGAASAGTPAALRYALALEELVEADGASAGTINCHVDSLRRNPDLGGVAPCFALGRMTSRGCPWTCTGDLNTSLGMLLVASLGLPTMYHEMEAIDEDSNEVIFANSGEHDVRFSSITEAEVSANPWYPGGTPTPILSFQVAPGPASVVAVTSIAGRLRVIVAEGQFNGRSTTRTGTMTASFQFTGASASDAWLEWVRAGAGHHSCATDAHIQADLKLLCAHLGLELVVLGVDRAGQ